MLQLHLFPSLLVVPLVEADAWVGAVVGVVSCFESKIRPLKGELARVATHAPV